MVIVPLVFCIVSYVRQAPGISRSVYMTPIRIKTSSSPVACLRAIGTLGSWDGLFHFLHVHDSVLITYIIYYYITHVIDPSRRWKCTYLANPRPPFCQRLAPVIATYLNNIICDRRSREHNRRNDAEDGDTSGVIHSGHGQH